MCVQNVTVDTSMCIKKCNGMLVTSYSKETVVMDDFFFKEALAYKKYKKRFQGKDIKGYMFCLDQEPCEQPK